MCTILAESRHYQIINRFEMVFLRIKNKKKEIYIGDFYGDPMAADISDDESFCVTVGCGLIIYYLHKPYKKYCYGKSSQQWREFFNKKGEEWWIETVKIIDNSIILFSVEKEDASDGGEYQLNIHDYEIKKI